jgi:hypothetical protein
VLKVIAGSPSDVQPVFEAIVNSAAKLFVPWHAVAIEPGLRQLSPETGIFSKAAGDFWRFGRPKRPNGKVETKGKSAKAGCLRPFLALPRIPIGTAD